MNLSADQIAELVQGMSNAWGDKKPSDQRRAPRVHYRGRITIVPHSAGVREGAIEVEVIDFSQRGLCVSSATALPNGKQFTAHFPSKAAGAVIVLCNVIHCRPLRNGIFNIGAEFVCRLAHADALGPDKIQHSVDDIRSSILE